MNVFRFIKNIIEIDLVKSSRSQLIIMQKRHENNLII